MLYYLVAILDEKSYSMAEKIQKELSDTFDLYKNLPVLHITLEIIETDDLSYLVSSIEEILNSYSQFKVMVNGAICFDPPYKSVNLMVEKKGQIKRLTRELNTELKNRGFKVRDNLDDWVLHISLANDYFSHKKWSVEEYQNACSMYQNKRINLEIDVDNIQLWKPINDKDEMIVKKFILK